MKEMNLHSMKEIQCRYSQQSWLLLFMLLLLLYLFILVVCLIFCPLLVVQIENGLVEAVAVLISKMPRLRPESAVGQLGECFKSKPDFIKVYPNSAIH